MLRSGDGAQAPGQGGGRAAERLVQEPAADAVPTGESTGLGCREMEQSLHQVASTAAPLDMVGRKVIEQAADVGVQDPAPPRSKDRLRRAQVELQISDAQGAMPVAERGADRSQHLGRQVRHQVPHPVQADLPGRRSAAQLLREQARPLHTGSTDAQIRQLRAPARLPAVTNHPQRRTEALGPLAHQRPDQVGRPADGVAVVAPAGRHVTVGMLPEGAVQPPDRTLPVRNEGTDRQISDTFAGDPAGQGGAEPVGQLVAAGSLRQVDHHLDLFLGEVSAHRHGRPEPATRAGRHPERARLLDPQRPACAAQSRPARAHLGGTPLQATLDAYQPDRSLAARSASAISASHR